MTIAAMENPDAIPPALLLLQKYCNEAPIAFQKHGLSHANPWPGRFKVSVRVENIEKYGLPSFITQYNAKPVLIRSTGFVHRYVSIFHMRQRQGLIIVGLRIELINTLRWMSTFTNFTACQRRLCKLCSIDLKPWSSPWDFASRVEKMMKCPKL
jgi:hypothetical protein